MGRNPALDPAYYHEGTDEPARVARGGAARRQEAVADAPKAPAPPDPPKSAEALSGDVSDYHLGGGYYEIPGHEGKLRGKDDAQVALDALRRG